MMTEKRYTDFEDENYWNVIKDNETGEILHDAVKIAAIMNETSETIRTQKAIIDKQEMQLSKVQEILQEAFNQNKRHLSISSAAACIMIRNIAKDIGVELDV